MSMRWWEQLDGPVLGRYRIDRLLGEGGMARVFLATDVRADRPVAFKTPKLESFPPESVGELLSRFSREFRSQASDPIQGVIPIYESGEFTDGDGVVRPFLAMQYLSGGSLGDLLGGDIGRRAHRQTLAEVLDWLVPIARTVDRLHARKYLHRDIKPDNILFNSDGDPFLADLGIVGTLDPSIGTSTMLGSTALGVLGSPGSPGYQSPESIQADPSLRNIAASDQFSLAVTVYEALAGRLPVDAGTNQAWYGALMHWSPIPMSSPCPDLPAAASDAVMKAMSMQASGRFTSCSEFAKAMALSAQVRSAPPTPTPPPPRAETRRTQAPAAPAPAPPSDLNRPLSFITKARIAAALVAVVVVPLGLSLGWGDSAPSADATQAPATNATSAAADPGVQASADPSSDITSANPFAEASVPAPSTSADTAMPAGAAMADCRTGDDDGDGFNDCDDRCPTTRRGAAVDDEGCARTLASLRAVQFGKGSITLVDDQLDVLSEALVLLKKHPKLKLAVLGHADRGEGDAAKLERLSLERARKVMAYLVLRGIPAAALSAASMAALDPAGSAGKNSRVTLVEAKELKPVEASQVPTVIAALPAASKWTYCYADGEKPDGKTLVYSLSAAMDVGAMPDWQDRLKKERPFELVLKAAGVVKLGLDDVNITCSPFKPTVIEAAVSKEALLQRYREQKGKEYAAVQFDPNQWAIRGAQVDWDMQ